MDFLSVVIFIPDMFKMPTQLPLPQAASTTVAPVVSPAGNQEIVRRGAQVATSIMMEKMKNKTAKIDDEKWHVLNGYAPFIFGVV